MDEDAEESGGLFVWVFLQLGLDLDDECRGHGREQTGLSLELACVRRICLKTHKYQGGVQIFVMFLDEFLIVFVGLLAVVLVEFGSRILLGRLCVLDRAVGEFQYESEGTGGWTLPVGRFPAQCCILPVPLLFYGTPAGIRCQKPSATLMQVTAIHWCGSSVLTGVAHAAGASAAPRSEIQVLSEDPNKHAIQRTVFSK